MRGGAEAGQGPPLQPSFAIELDALASGSVRGVMVSVLSCGLSSGCAEPSTIVTGEVTPGTASLLVGLSQEDELYVEASPSTEALALEFPSRFDEQTPIRVTRIELAHALEDLGLSAGPVLPAAAPHHRVQDLPRRAMSSAIVEVGGRVELQMDAADPRFERLTLPYPTCPRFRREEIPELAASGRTEGRAALPGGGAVFGGPHGFVIALPEERPFFVATPGAYALSVAAAPEGGVWWVSNLSLGRFDLGTRQVTQEVPAAEALCPSALVVLSEAPTLVFVLDCLGLVRRYDEGGWSVDYEIPREHYVGLPLRRAQMLPLGPDEFLVGAQNLGPILRYRAGTYRSELLELAGRGFPAFFYDRSGRLWAVEYRGELYTFEDEGWRPGPTLPPSSYGFGPIGALDLMLFSTDSGAIGAFSPEAGVVCGPEQLGELAGVPDMIALGDRFLVAGNLGSENQPARWLWLTPE